MALSDQRGEGGAAISPGAVTALIARLAREEDLGGEPVELAPGTRVGRYEVIRVIGRGGFGAVYEAHDPRLHRLVALKVLVRRRAAHPEDAGEGEAAARLAHPNIAALHDAGITDDGTPYLVYELLHGETLESRLARGPLAPGDAVEAAIGVAHALGHAHEAGVVHRDLKPANVFLTADGGVKVLDFGVALVFGRTTPAAGTPAYMAPEQRRGAPEDARTDLYALGLLLREMLTAAPPRASGSELPATPALRAAVAALLAEDPAARPRSARVALEMLEAARAGIAARRPRRLGRRGVALAMLATAVVAAAVIVAATSWRTATKEPAAAPSPPTPPSTRATPAAPDALPSIAVLPFVDLSPRKDQGYFSDGLAEEIIDALAQLEGLHVAGRTSSFWFKGRTDDLATIAAKLRVSSILEGSVRKAGNRVRITAQLVSTADGYHLWSQTFDRKLSDVFAIQDEIAKAVVAALRVKLLANQAPSTRDYRTPNPEVHDLYLRGRALRKRMDEVGLRDAMDVLSRAVALDASYAPAWVELAFARYWFGNARDDHAEFARYRQRALEAADRAIALAPDLGDAYVARGTIRSSFLRERADAEADLAHALALQPGDASALTNHAAFVLTAGGRYDEAIAQLRLATRLDPLLAHAWGALGAVHLARGELEDARVAFTRAHELAPESMIGPHNLTQTLVLEGRPADARPLLQVPRTAFRDVDEVLVEAGLGHTAKARRLLEDLEARSGGVAAFQIAEVYGWWGERDRALDWLERAFAQDDGGLIELRASPLLASVRGLPRFEALAAKLGLAEPRGSAPEPTRPPITPPRTTPPPPSPRRRTSSRRRSGRRGASPR